MRTLGEEVCELVGKYIHSELSKLFDQKHRGLYSDNRLPDFKDKSGPE